MALITCKIFTSSPPLISTLKTRPLTTTTTTTCRCIRASPAPLMSNSGGGGGFMEFPYASPPVRDLMADLVSTVENRLGSLLLPCTLPADVQRYRNDSGTADAALLVRSGIASSPIDFMLGSWLHCQLPTGATLNITSLSCYLNDSTDAPHFLFELIQTSGTSIIVVLDLPPRKDLVLHPDYLQKFYEDTGLDITRQFLDKVAEVRPFVSSSLFTRSAVSPSAILVRIESEAGGSGRVEEIVGDDVRAVATEVLRIWLDCLNGRQEVEDVERNDLRRRDRIFKSKIIEIDLVSNLPRLFGQETADRILAALRGVFGI
ncbi:Red chlorophyll catabolite reductase, chloroplastic-like protein [Drosera capensis]